MKNLYVAYRWRYLLFMYPSFLCSSLFAHYISNLISEPAPVSILGVVLHAGLILGIVILFTATPMIKMADIEVSRAGVVGPVNKGFLKVRRERFSFDEIDLSSSKCRLFRSYLQAYDGRKLLIAAPVLGMRQVRSLFSQIRNAQF